MGLLNDLRLYRQLKGVVLTGEEGKTIAKTQGPGKAYLLHNHHLSTVSQTVMAVAFWFMSLNKCCHAQMAAKAANSGLGKGRPIVIKDYVEYTFKSVENLGVCWFNIQSIFDLMIEQIRGAYLICWSIILI